LFDPSETEMGEPMSTEQLYQLGINFQQLEASKRRVFDLLSDGAWHSTREIQQAGGCDGCRRLRELRLMGAPIDGEKMPESNGWRYRLRLGQT
jgi:predicted DNA-binding ArsR family transcriptional regulator